MADFVVKLWDSIFTPGTTPTLLLATNGTFAALETVLIILFALTWNIHFIVLFTIAGGLWYSINWFARELAIHAAAEEEEKKRIAEASKKTASARATDDSDTEVEGLVASGRKKRVTKAVGGSSQIETKEQTHEADLRRRVDAAESVAESKNEESSVSTEDEWEKVSEAENEKEK